MFQMKLQLLDWLNSRDTYLYTLIYGRANHCFMQYYIP
jgi:hypothetical protein